MKSINKLLLNTSDTIKKALEVIDDGTMRIAIVIDNNKKFLGTLNDGDVRRSLLNGYTLESTIENIYESNATTCNIEESKDEIIKKAITHKRNKVILMAGGLGTRLQPLTDNTPKPLLKVGSKPILETIINNFANYGFTDITISVNYKAQMIKDYFRDGSDFGVNIEYIEENQRLGTAGALSLLKNPPKEPFFVMNADLLTNVNFSHFLDFHSYGNGMATMCVREFEYKIPYGVIETFNDKITSITEKPTHKFFVNAGIYLLSPKVLEYIPQDQFYDMPTLFEKLISESKNTLSFPIHEYWLDIGQHNDFIQANNEYSQVFQ